MTKIRRAKVEDAEAAAAAYEAAWDAAHAEQLGKKLGELIDSSHVAEAFRDGVAKTGDGSQIFVADSDDGIAGLAIVVSAGDGTGELTHLYVRPDQWGRGIGTALHASSIRELEAMGASKLTLWVAEANQRARDFYVQAGWAPDGQTRQSPLGPTELRYTMSP